MTAPAEQLTSLIAALIAHSARRLPDDVYARLEEMRAAEDSPLGQKIYRAMFASLDLAAAQNRPCCQDTGVLQFFAGAGASFPLLAELPGILRKAAVRATAAAPLRPNVVECFDEKNTGDNTGTGIPWIEWDILPGGGLRLFVYMAGGGCSLPGFARVFTPLEGYEAAAAAVLGQITSLGVNACPPLLAGIGLGNSADTAASLSKKALLRTIGARSGHPKAAELEKRLEAALNRTGIGPGGFGGRQSVMAVHVEHAGRHTATLAAALSTGCWAHRRMLIEIEDDLSYRVPTHRKSLTIDGGSGGESAGLSGGAGRGAAP